MKQVYLFIVFSLFSFLLHAQSKDSVVVKDSVVIVKDSVIKALRPLSALEQYNIILPALLKDHRFLNSTGVPVRMYNIPHKDDSQDFFFYVLTGIVLFLAAAKYLYARYFNNLFRVFFNTSLRQSQLTDQLLQAKQASLLFNILFVLTGGIYIYFLLQHKYANNSLFTDNMILVLVSCILCLAIIYFVKYLSLKFTGWLTGYHSATNTYLFVTFLINKIVGIILVPVIIIIAFSVNTIVQPVIAISMLIIVLMLLLRFFRSYGLLQNQLKVSRFHFLVYIIGAEVLPLLLIYKALMILLNKNL